MSSVYFIVDCKVRIIAAVAPQLVGGVALVFQCGLHKPVQRVRPFEIVAKTLLCESITCGEIDVEFFTGIGELSD